MEHGVKNHEDDDDGNRNHNRQSLGRTFLAFILSGPIDVITRRQLYLLADFVDGLLDSSSEIAPSDAVFDGHITRITFTINLRRAIGGFYVAQLSQRHSFARWRQQADVLDSFLGIPIRSLIAQYKVEASFALQHLAHGIAANRGLNRILHIGDVETKACCLLPVYSEI